MPNRSEIIFKNQKRSMERFGVIDLCSGMGGLSYAAKESGLNVWAGVDTSTSALSSFRYNFPSASAVHGDVSDKDLLEQIIVKLV